VPIVISKKANHDPLNTTERISKMPNAIGIQKQATKGALIACGERVVEHMIHNFGQEVITAPFGEAVFIFIEKPD
jgi:hypothetical protein